jgi:hypothetical protein
MVNQSFDGHQWAYAQAKTLCEESMNLASKEKITCSDTPALTTFDWFYSICENGASHRPLNGFEGCLQYLNENLSFSSDNGFWPAARAQSIDKKFLEQEVARIRKLDLQLRPAEERILSRMELMFNKYGNN